MPYADMLDAAELAAFSSRYREACAGAVKAGEMNFMGIDIGHGTYLMMARAAEACGSKRTLLVVPQAAAETAKGQLDRHDCAVRLVDRKKGAMTEACRQMADYQGNRHVVYIAAPRQMAEAGHWLEAWRDRKPFDFIAVADADKIVNLRSEQGRGLETVARRAGTALLAYDRNAANPGNVSRAVQAWNAVPCRVDLPACPD